MSRLSTAKKVLISIPLFMVAALAIWYPLSQLGVAVKIVKAVEEKDVPIRVETKAPNYWARNIDRTAGSPQAVLSFIPLGEVRLSQETFAHEAIGGALSPMPEVPEVRTISVKVFNSYVRKSVSCIPASTNNLVQVCLITKGSMWTADVPVRGNTISVLVHLTDQSQPLVINNH